MQRYVFSAMCNGYFSYLWEVCFLSNTSLTCDCWDLSLCIDVGLFFQLIVNNSPSQTRITSCIMGFYSCLTPAGMGWGFHS